MNKFGEKIKAERLARGMTQASVAKAIGASRSSIPQWEQGNTRRLMVEPFLNICLVFNLSPFWLWFGKGEKNISKECEKLPDKTEIIPPISGGYVGQNFDTIVNALANNYSKEPDKMNASTLSELFKVEDKSLLFILKVISNSWKKKDIVETFDDIIEEATLARENEIAMRQAGLKVDKASKQA